MRKRLLKIFIIIFGIVLVLSWGLIVYFILWSVNVHHFTLLIIVTLATFVWVIMAHSLINPKTVNYNSNKLSISYQDEEFKRRRKELAAKLLEQDGVIKN